MKIAITATGDNPAAEVDPRFGRARNFLIYDTDTETYSVIPNDQDMNAMSGAGVQSGQKVADAGVSAVLTGHCGPKAFRVLQAADIRIITGVSGTVAEAVADYLAGRTEESSSANVDGHWA